jgi:hypothetical protein
VNRAKALAKTFQEFIDAKIPQEDRTAEFTIDGAAYYRVTPGQRTVLMAMAPAMVRQLNDSTNENDGGDP